MRRADSSEKTLMLGKIVGRRRRGSQRMRWFDGITDSMDMGLGGLWEVVTDFIWWGRGPKSLQMVIAAVKLKHACSLEEKL